MEIQIDSAADQSILTALREGKRRQAGQLLVRYYGNLVFNVCRTLVPTLEEAEDLTQASFTRAFSDLGGIQGSMTPRIWLMNVAQACCASHLESAAGAEELPLPSARQRPPDQRVAPAPARDAGLLAVTSASLAIPHERFRLANGLDVILHHDERLPRVVVNVLYRVGSRNDPPGRTGIAHLFEHLMFMGTKRVPEGQLDLLMEELGGSNNAFTSEDVTVYYDHAPERGLELLLEVEADRMATLARALTRKKLDLQRDVVLNERSEHYENAPYGAVWLELPALLFPERHPYSWPVIGAREDLRAVTVADVRELFARFYSPRNACLTVAGSFDPERARALIRRCFERIPAAAPPRRPRHRPVRLAAPVRRRLVDRVELPKLFLCWPSPPSYAPGDAELDLATSILAVGRRSRLHRELVFERELAVEVAAHQESRQLGSQLLIEVTARPETPLAELERVTRRALARFLARPPGRRELEAAQVGYEVEFIGRLESLARRAELLNLYFAATGEPDHVEADLARYRRASVGSVWRACRETLARPELAIEVVPGERGAS